MHFSGTTDALQLEIALDIQGEFSSSQTLIRKVKLKKGHRVDFEGKLLWRSAAQPCEIINKGRRVRRDYRTTYVFKTTDDRYFTWHAWTFRPWEAGDVVQGRATIVGLDWQGNPVVQRVNGKRVATLERRARRVLSSRTTKAEKDALIKEMLKYRFRPDLPKSKHPKDLAILAIERLSQ